MIRGDPDALLRRDATADALTKAGFPTSPATLATKATRGGGPPYRSWGRLPLYRWGDALGWAQSRLSPPPSSTSEADTNVISDIRQRATFVPDSQPGNAAAERVMPPECSHGLDAYSGPPSELVASSSRTENRARYPKTLPPETRKWGGKKRARRKLDKNRTF